MSEEVSPPVRVTTERPARTPWTWVASALAAFTACAGHLAEVHADPDLWWHLHTGLRMLDTLEVPSADDLSFTASGLPWTDHEWLAELLLAVAFRIGGNAGLLGLRDLLVLAVVGGLTLLLSHRLREPLLMFLCLAPAVAALAVFLSLRAHVFSLAALVSTMVVFDRARGGDARWLAALPVGMALWVNLHGGFLLGVTLVAIQLLVIRWEAPTERRPAKTALWLCGLATGLATLLNPHGPFLYGYLCHELSATHEGITEWAAPDAAQASYLAVFVGVPLLLSAVGSRGARPGSLALLSLIALATLTHARLFAFVALLAPVVAADGLGPWLDHLRSRQALPALDRWLSDRVALLVLAIALALLSAPMALRATRGEWGVTVDGAFAPIRAVEWLKQEFVGPNLGLPLHWGGYAIWHLAPGYRVAVDGRNLTVYEGAWVDAYNRAYREGRGQAVLPSHRVDAWLVEAEGRQAVALREQGWSDAYRDPLAAVLVRPSRVAVSGPPPPPPPVFFP